jgi:hypothetical protein
VVGDDHMYEGYEKYKTNRADENNEGHEKYDASQKNEDSQEAHKDEKEQEQEQEQEQEIETETEQEIETETEQETETQTQQRESRLGRGGRSNTMGREPQRHARRARSTTSPKTKRAHPFTAWQALPFRHR